MSTLAETFGVDPSAVTYRVRRMNDRGLVVRNKCPSDGRGVNAELTDKGREILVEIAPMHVDSVRREFLDLLTDRELKTIGDAFERIRAHQMAAQA